MNKKFSSFVTVILLAWPIAAHAENAYLAAIPDVPLMAGLAEPDPENSTLVFDKAEGRIAEETVASKHPLSMATIFEFYQTALPQLGWQVIAREKNMQRFVRNQEQLVVMVEQIGTGNSSVHFALSPRR